TVATTTRAIDPPAPPGGSLHHRRHGRAPAHHKPRPYKPHHVEGAPDHGEGHNSGQALNITASIAVKRLMGRAGLTGTIKLWPGVAEELLGTKAYLVRDGHFRGVDVVLFTHVGDNLGV